VPTVDLILPCYNPQEYWVSEILSSVKEIKKRLPDLQLNIILVNDGSTVVLDPAQIEKLRTQLPQFTFIDNAVNKGKGHALRVGIAQSKQTICMFTDVDFPYTPDSFITVYQALTAEDCEVAVGIRDNSYYASTPFARKVISKTFKQMLKTFFRLQVSDTQCGLKGFNLKGKELFLGTTIDRYLFDLEFIQLASRKFPKQIKGVPVILKEGIVFSKLNSKILLQEGLSFLRIFFTSIFKKK